MAALRNRCGHYILPCGFFLSFFMVALWNRADHYIFMLLIVLSSSFFLASSQPPQIGCLPYFHTWRGPSANLECRSETCCTRLAENTGRKKSRQKSPSGHHRTNLSGYIFAMKARIDNPKKLLKQQYLLHMSLQYGELRPTNG